MNFAALLVLVFVCFCLFVVYLWNDCIMVRLHCLLISLKIFVLGLRSEICAENPNLYADTYPK